jgi:hypothetical protein
VSGRLIIPAASKCKEMGRDDYDTYEVENSSTNYQHIFFHVTSSKVNESNLSIA